MAILLFYSCRIIFIIRGLGLFLDSSQLTLPHIESLEQHCTKASGWASSIAWAGQENRPNAR